MESTFFSQSRILVTGGTGFVGSNLVKRLLQLSVRQIHIVDNLLSSEKCNLPDDPRITFIEGSIADDNVLSALSDEYDFIFHLSTYHGNQSSIADPIADHQNNTLTTLKLFEHIKNWEKVKKIVYSAAGCAVAEKTHDIAHETSEDAPISLVMDSPYSISKIIGEYYAVYYYNQHNLPTVRARFQNVYGPGEILGAGRWRGTPATVWRNVTPTFIFKSLKHLPLPIEGDGSATRDFIFVEDIVEGLLRCASHGEPGDVYNLASGVETSILELATIINEYTGNEGNIEYLPGRPWDHSGKRFGSTTKSKQEIGFEASVTIREGLATTIQWTRNNLSLIERCISKHDKYMK